MTGNATLRKGSSESAEQSFSLYDCLTLFNFPTMSGSSNTMAMKKVVQQLRFEASINRVKVRRKPLLDGRMATCGCFSPHDHTTVIP